MRLQAFLEDDSCIGCALRKQLIWKGLGFSEHLPETGLGVEAHMKSQGRS
jgi:hypothetical protein